MFIYDRIFEPAPEPPKPVVIPTPTVDDDGKFLGISNGNFSFKSIETDEPFIIETSTNSIDVTNSEISKKLKTLATGGNIWVRVTSSITISNIEFNPFTAKIISILSRRYGMIVNNGDYFYMVNIGVGGTFVVSGKIPS